MAAGGKCDTRREKTKQSCGGNVATSERAARSPTSMLQAGASERARWPSQIYSNLREFGYGGRRLVNPRQQTSLANRACRSAGSFRASRSCDGDRAGTARPDVLADAEAGVKSATIYVRDRRRRERSVARTRRVARIFSRAAVCTSAAQTAWAPIRTASGCSPIRTPNCAACRPGRSPEFSSPAERCSSGSRARPNGVWVFPMQSRRAMRPISTLPTIWIFWSTIRIPNRSSCSSRASDEATRSCVRPAVLAAEGKPVLAIKTGATAKSRAAANSHTGAIGGD